MTDYELLARMSAQLLAGDLAAKGARYLDDGIVDHAAVVTDAANILKAIENRQKDLEDKRYAAQQEQFRRSSEIEKQEAKTRLTDEQITALLQTKPREVKP
jgi:hypothetical protein